MNSAAATVAMPAGEARPLGISQSRVPRQSLNSRRVLAELGLLGLEHMCVNDSSSFGVYLQVLELMVKDDVMY